MYTETRLAKPSFAAAFISYLLLNLADVSLTKISLERFGALEANPVMAAMFADGFLAALAFKMAAVFVVGMIAFKLWDLGYVRKILFGGVWLMTAVIIYQLSSIAALI